MVKKKKSSVASSKHASSLLRTLGIIIAAIGILTYIRTIGYDYALDDFSIIKENRVTTMGVSGIPTIFHTPYRYGYDIQGDQLYRPVPKSIFAILWSMSPGNPMPAHLLNVLLYGLTGFLLFITLSRLTAGNLYIPFITSILFIVHPIHSEVVANIKSLDEILSWLFFLLSVYWIQQYILTNRMRWLVFAASSYFISLLSKESAITFIAVVPLLLYFFYTEKRSSILKIIGVMAIPAIIFLIIRAMIFKGTTPALPPEADNMLLMVASDITTQKAMAIFLIGNYIKLLFFPHPIVYDYSLFQLPLVKWTDWRFILSLVVLMAAGVYALMTFKNKNRIAFGILFFFITISISSNLFIIIGTHFAERLMYVPSFAFCFIVACLLVLFIDKKKEEKQKFATPTIFLKSKPLLMSIVGGLTVVMLAKSFVQAGYWRDNLTLCEHGVKSAPNNMRTHYFLGNYLIGGDYFKTAPLDRREADRTRGMAELRKSISIYPYSESYFSLGIAHYLKHEYDSSLYYYNEALKRAPSIAKYHNNLATVYFELNQLDKALAECQMAVQLDPNYAEAFCNLGSVYGMMNKMDEAVLNFQKALAIAPNHARTNFYMGKVLQVSTDPGEKARAQYYLDKAASLDPQYK